MKYKLESGQHILKDKYKDISDVIEDIWVLAVNSFHKAQTDFDRRDAALIIQKYYLKPDGTEYEWK